ncbi:MAG: HIT domain-containing protein [Saprospiraceae bacterium]
MLFHDSKNPNSRLTAIQRNKVSYPTRILFQQGKIEGKVLDFGCGHGADVDFLRKRNIDITGFDPFHYNHYPTEKFDRIVCHYVLNVLMPKEQAFVLMAISELLKPNGKAYFTVRRDLKRQGFRTHFEYNVSTYQCNVRLNLPIAHKAEHCEIYEYQHYNQTKKDNDCVFCSPESERELITESATMYAILDKFPVSNGHTLIISKRHKNDYFALAEKEKMALQIMIERVKTILDKRYQPDGYNIGMNCGEAAGQTVSHFHCHIIPRYKGDMKNPKGGVRHCVEGKGFY